MVVRSQLKNKRIKIQHTHTTSEVLVVEKSYRPWNEWITLLICFGYDSSEPSEWRQRTYSLCRMCVLSLSILLALCSTCFSYKTVREDYIFRKYILHFILDVDGLTLSAYCVACRCSTQTYITVLRGWLDTVSILCCLQMFHTDLHFSLDMDGLTLSAYCVACRCSTQTYISVLTWMAWHCQHTVLLADVPHRLTFQSWRGWLDTVSILCCLQMFHTDLHFSLDVDGLTLSAYCVACRCSTQTYISVLTWMAWHCQHTVLLADVPHRLRPFPGPL